MVDTGMIIGLALLGLLAGSQVNRAIYRLAWEPRSIGPWSPPAEGAAGRHWSDYLPVIGWLGLRTGTWREWFPVARQLSPSPTWNRTET